MPKGLSMFRWFSRAAAEPTVWDLQRDVALLRTEVAKLSTKVSTTAGAQLTVRCDENDAAIAALAQANRREFGRLWKLVGLERGPGDAPPPTAVDDDLEAFLRLQSAPPATPGTRT